MSQSVLPSPPPARIGIVAALPEEAAGLFEEMAKDRRRAVVLHGGRDFHHGSLWDRECVLTLARVGKVAAATTATALIHDFKVSEILFTGVAGAGARSVSVGDIVVGDSFLQHDLDASPIFPRHEVPLTGLSRFPADETLTRRLAEAVASFLSDGLPTVPTAARERLRLTAPRLHRGLVISGDRFVSTAAEAARLRAELPDALAIEMEGAAVAQVCHDYAVPFALMRTISDSADDAAHVDFPAFLRDVASHYSTEVIRRLLTGSGAAQAAA